MQKKLSILSLALVWVCASSAQARVINPLIAPKPAGTEQAQGAPANPSGAANAAGMPGSAANQARGNMPQGLPPPPPNPSMNGMMDSGVKKKEEVTFPSELVGLDDKWFVSAITGTSAILRLRDASIGAVSAPTQATGQPSSGMPPGMGSMNAMSGMGGASAPPTAGSGVIQRSLLVSNGKPLEFKGYPLQVSVQEGIVRLSYTHEGQRVNVFQSGVDVFAVRRAPQVTKETPAANLPGLMKAGTTPAASQTNTTPQSNGMGTGVPGQSF